MASTRVDLTTAESMIPIMPRYTTYLGIYLRYTESCISDAIQHR